MVATLITWQHRVNENIREPFACGSGDRCGLPCEQLGGERFSDHIRSVAARRDMGRFQTVQRPCTSEPLRRTE